MEPTESRELWVQLATRIPRTLHRGMKVHCVRSEMSVMDFVVNAIADALNRPAGAGRSRRSHTSS